MHIMTKTKKTATSVISSALLTLLLSTQAHAGAWVLDKGKGYTKVGITDYSADEFFGDNPDLGEFEGQSISFYGELGLGNNWGVYVSTLYQDIEQTDASGASLQNDGFSDFEVGVKYQWQLEPFVLSTSFAAKLPYLYDEDDALPLGNGQEDYEARILIGKSLNQYGYVGVELGYRLRSGDPSDEIRYLLEYGISLNDNLYFRAKLDGIESANNASNNIVNGVNLSRQLEFDVGKLELTAGWNFGEPSEGGARWGAEITYNEDLFGDQALEGSGVQLALTRVF